jgi:hypothetical protein
MYSIMDSFISRQGCFELKFCYVVKLFLQLIVNNCFINL